MSKDDRLRTTVQYPRPSLVAETKLTPEVLAVQLDAWALRREKVLVVLDRSNAAIARKLAERCRALAATSVDVESDLVLRHAWDAIQQEASALFVIGGAVDTPSDPKKCTGNE